MVGIDSDDGFSVATHRKTGWRSFPSGQTHALDLDLKDTARYAVNALLNSELPAATDEEVRRRGVELVEESGRLSALLYDSRVWPTRPLVVDGEAFALFVLTMSNGQAAVADLGPVRLVLSGASIPPALALRTLPLTEVPLKGRAG